jgi:hypothetical protein
MTLIDFEGNLKKIDPARIIREEARSAFDDFFLVLAYIYNDLKGLTFFQIQMTEKYRVPRPGEITYHAGEYGGFNLQLYRIVIATIHEFFEFLKKNKGILSTGKFYLIKNKLSPQSQKIWSEIVDIALGKIPESSNFTNVLLRIRNNIAFHYFDANKNLRKGFIDRFFKKERTELNGNQYAYYAFGKEMAHTRFFYADAAAQEFIFNVSQDTADTNFQDVIGPVIHNMNETLFSLLKEYIQSCHVE